MGGRTITEGTWASGISRAAELAGKEGGPNSDETGATLSTRVRPWLDRDAASGCCDAVNGDPTSSSNLQVERTMTHWDDGQVELSSAWFCGTYVPLLSIQAV